MIKGIKYKVKILYSIFYVLILFIYVCKSSAKTIPNNSLVSDTESVEIISDLLFDNGIGLKGTNSSEPGIHEVLTLFDKGVSNPSWTLA